MMSIATAQSKGGTGKSTVAIHLAVTATHLGYKTVLIDTDVQRSATNWGKRRSAHAPAIMPMDANALSDRLDKLASDFDLAFVDTPGHDLKALSRAAVSVDLTLIVSRPARFDIETAIEVRDRSPGRPP